MAFSTIFFDMDGTLCDSKPGITECVRYTLKQYGIDEKAENLTGFIGPPLRDSFRKFYGFDEQTAEEAADIYRARYGEHGVFALTLYPGIPELLAALHDAGKKLILATAKSENHALQILDHTGLARFFHFAGGSDRNTRRLGKDQVLRYILDATGIRDLAACVMVGDREHDVLGAHAVGMRCAAVLYGYGQREELEAAGADYIIPTVAALREWLLRTAS